MWQSKFIFSRHNVDRTDTPDPEPSRMARARHIASLVKRMIERGMPRKLERDAAGRPVLEIDVEIVDTSLVNRHTCCSARRSPVMTDRKKRPGGAR
jgi:hypothetical protein